MPLTYCVRSWCTIHLQSSCIKLILHERLCQLITIICETIIVAWSCPCVTRQSPAPLQYYTQSSVISVINNWRWPHCVDNICTVSRIQTRSSAVVERPHKAPCHWKFCCHSRLLKYLVSFINWVKTCHISSPKWWICCFEVDVSGCTWAMTLALGDPNETVFLKVLSLHRFYRVAQIKIPHQTSWLRKLSNMTVGQSSLISWTHHCYNWHPGSRCGWTCNQLTSKVDGDITGSRLRW